MSNRTQSQSQPNELLGNVWGKWNKRLLTVSALGLCGLCSCTGIDRPQSGKPLQSSRETQSIDSDNSITVPPRNGAQVIIQNRTAIRPQSEESSESEATQRPASSRRRPAGIARYQFTPEVQNGPQNPPSNRPVTGIQRISGENVRRVTNTDRAIERIAAEERVPASQSDAFASGPVLDDDGPSTSKYPDEYLFDGGDRNYPRVHEGDQLTGIETEDTIAEYKDHEGKARTKKSNRVAIYSPRFGSVVSISRPNSDTIVDKLKGHVVAQGGVGLRNRLSTEEKRQNLETVRIQTQSRPTGLGTEIGTTSLSKEVNREVGVSIMKMHQSRGQWKKSEFQENLKASSAKGRQFAEHWTRKDFPVLEGHASGATQTITLQVTAEYVGLEDNGKRGDLLLTKTADKGEASIGDLVTFTIYYENRGDKELKSVVIIDNLSPRLEFLPDSVTTDRPGKLTAHDNDEGSVVLKFTLDESLPGRTKGSIIFQAKVK